MERIYSKLTRQMSLDPPSPLLQKRFFTLMGVLTLGYGCWTLYRDQSEYQVDESAGPKAARLVKAPADRLDPALDGKLIYLTASATTFGPVTDPYFRFSTPALRLDRDVTKYGWGPVTKYVTAREGKRQVRREVSEDQLIWKPVTGGPASSLTSCTFLAERVQLGPFALAPSLFDAQHTSAPDSIRPKSLKLPPNAFWSANTLYLNGRPQRPQEGDIQVCFRVYPLRKLTVIGTQRQNRLTPPPGETQVWWRPGWTATSEYYGPPKRPPEPRQGSGYYVVYVFLVGLSFLQAGHAIKNEG